MNTSPKPRNRAEWWAREQARRQLAAPEGHPNSKKQLRSLAAIKPQLATIASVLESIFDGGFEKTCTPEIAGEYARTFDADLRRISSVVGLLQNHAGVLGPHNLAGVQVQQKRTPERILGLDGKSYPPRPDPELPERIRALHNDGHSMRQIARELNCSVGTVHRHLKL